MEDFKWFNWRVQILAKLILNSISTPIVAELVLFSENTATHPTGIHFIKLDSTRFIKLNQIHLSSFIMIRQILSNFINFLPTYQVSHNKVYLLNRPISKPPDIGQKIFSTRNLCLDITFLKELCLNVLECLLSDIWNIQ